VCKKYYEYNDTYLIFPFPLGSNNSLKNTSIHKSLIVRKISSLDGGVLERVSMMNAGDSDSDSDADVLTPSSKSYALSLLRGMAA
jgi:hypothetical protein